MAVNLNFAISEIICGKSRGLVIKTLSPPIFKINKQLAVSENIWYSGNAVIIISLPFLKTGLNQASACMTFAIKFRCVNMAPFATPVVPPVYCKKARSWEVRSTGVNVKFLPFVIAALNAIALGIVILGTFLWIYFKTKSTINALGCGNISPTFVMIIFFIDVIAKACWTVSTKFAKTKIVCAPEFCIWCANSGGV